MEALGEPIGLAPLELAASIVEIANENMASAIKMVSLERGHDPRRFSLLAFGGAGPLHAAAVARVLGIPRVIVPQYPGVFSALGLLLADIRVDKIWTQAFRSNDVDAPLVNRQFGRITERALAELRQEGFAGEPRGAARRSTCATSARTTSTRSRSRPASWTRPRSSGRSAASTSCTPSATATRSTSEVIELVSFKVTAIGKRAPLDFSRANGATGLRALASGRSTSAATASSTRSSRTARRSSRARSIAGPAVIEEEGSTLFVEPGMTVERTPQGALVIQTGVRHERRRRRSTRSR